MEKYLNFKKALLYSILILGIIPLFTHFYMRPQIGDEGILAMDAFRITKGQIPHRDFFEFIPPLAAYIQAFFFKIFGTNIFSIRLLGTIYGIILLFGTYLFYKRVFRDQFFIALPLSLLSVWGVQSWHFGSHHWLVDILQIFGTLFLLDALEKNSIIKSIIAGIFFGLATFTLQDQGGYIAIFLLFFSIITRKDERKLFFYSLLSHILTFAILTTPFVYLANIKTLFRDWVWFPIFNYKETKGNKFDFNMILKDFLEHWDFDYISANPFFRIPKAFLTSLTYFSPILMVFSLFYLFNKKFLEKKKRLLVLMVSITFLLGAMHRLALTNIRWGFLLELPFFLMLEDITLSKKGFISKISKFFSIFLFVAILMFTFFEISAHFHKDFFTKVGGKAGYYYVSPKREGEILKDFIEKIEKYVENDEPLFCFGYIPLINFITLRDNPTRFNCMFPTGYYSKSQIYSFLESLERKKIKWGYGERKYFKEGQIQKYLPSYYVFYENENFCLVKRKD